MKTILICPGERPELDALSDHAPLALVPVCGTPLLHLALRELAGRGVRDILILASDRPGEIRAAVEGGAPWGVAASVLATPCEPTVEDALERHAESDADVLRLETFLPSLSGGAEPSGLADWFKAARGQIAVAGGRQLMTREIAPGCVAHASARISETAKLVGPVWIGEDAVVEDGAIVGPGAVLETGCIVDRGAEISESMALPGTYMGRGVKIEKRIVDGARLTRWDTGDGAEVRDAILLADLNDRRAASLRPGVFGRAMAALALALTWPAAVCVWLARRLEGRPASLKRRAVSPLDGSEIHYHELQARGRYLRRWPRLWNILRGEFRWVGNPPLTPEQAGELATEPERLWLTAPVGLFSLQDAQGGDADPSEDEARAHAGYYAAFRCFRLDCSILSGIVRSNS